VDFNDADFSLVTETEYQSVPFYGIMNYSSRVLPDTNICRAKENGLRGYADCLVEKPFRCQYTVSFGGGFFCCYPNREEIIQNTISARQNDQERNSRVR